MMFCTLLGLTRLASRSSKSYRKAFDPRSPTDSCRARESGVSSPLCACAVSPDRPDLFQDSIVSSGNRGRAFER